VRGLFRQLTEAAVIAVNPFEKSTVRLEEENGSDTAAAPPEDAPVPAGFPLLDLLAMLGNTEEQTLRWIFDNEESALGLLRQVRWPDGQTCPACGAEAGDDLSPDAVCQACAAPYTVTTGTMFDGVQIPVRFWFIVIHQLYVAESVLPDDALRSRFGLDMPVLLLLCRRIVEAMAHEGLPSGDELREALAKRNREMVQDEVVRGVIEYAELDTARAYLVQARADGVTVADLPAGMTLAETIEAIEKRIAEYDRVVISKEDGYLVQTWAEPQDPAEPAEATDGK
jgi:Transposase zinc-ribbon domain